MLKHYAEDVLRFGNISYLDAAQFEHLKFIKNSDYKNDIHEKAEHNRRDVEAMNMCWN